MSHHCTFLSKDRFPEIYSTFMEAFSDYEIDSSHITQSALFNRAIKNGIDFESSVGVMDGEKMVGITLVGIDTWMGVRSAFDIGTGIVSSHRGRGIAREMFDFAVPRLVDEGAKIFLLEVLQTNEPAIRAYKAAGFRITRELDCFLWNMEKAILSESTEPLVDIRPVGKEILESFEQAIDWQPSWENSFASVRRIPDEVVMLGAFSNSDCMGLLVYYPLLNWITTLVVKTEYRRLGVASRLLTHFRKHTSSGDSPIKLLNVDHSDRGMIEFLTKRGFTIFTSQYEMELELSKSPGK